MTFDLEKISTILYIIRKNSSLFIFFGLTGLLIATTAHYLIQDRYEAEVHIQINYPIIKNQKTDQEVNNEMKILLLQARDQFFYVENMNTSCGTKSYSEFQSNLKILEVRGINSVLNIKFISNNNDYSKKCLKEVITRLDELIKIKTNKIKDNLNFKNEIIEKGMKKFINDFEKDNNNSTTLPLAYYLNKSHFDSLNQEYETNKQNIYELSKISYINQLSEINTHLKPIYRNIYTLYFITVAVSLLIAFCIAFLKDLRVFKNKK